MVRRNLAPARPPTHPGAILRQHVLPTLGMSVSEVAKALGVSVTYDFWHARQEMAGTLVHIPTVEAKAA